jgi:TolA-binding protein
MEKLILALVIVLTAVSCGNNENAAQKETTQTETPALTPPQPREEYISQIKKIEGEMHNAMEVDMTTANSAIQLYTDFATYFPNDSLAPEYLFKAGEVATGAKKYKRSLELYQTIAQKYPNYKHMMQSLYLQAFLLDNFLNDDAAAKTIYEEIISKYPNTNYAKDAKAAIEHLGKTDDQLIEEFEKKNEKK